MTTRNHNVLSNNPAAFEPLEDRRLCSTTIQIPQTAVADKIRYNAALAGVSDKVLNAALQTASSGKKKDQDQANRMIISAGLGLPADALKTKLNTKQLVDQAANLGLVGAGDKANAPDYWKTVRQLGGDFALAGAIRESLVLPVTETQGKSPKQLLDDSANIALLGASASSPKAWQGLALLKSHKITVEQFAQKYADGKDVVNQAKVVADQAALRTRVRNQINARNAAAKQNANSQPTNGYNPNTDIRTDKNYGHDGAAYTHPTNETNQAPAGTDPNGAEYTIDSKTRNTDGTTTVAWTMTYDGKTESYTTVYYPADSSGPAWYEVYDSSGGWVGTGEGTPPADDTVGTTTQTTDGDQAIFPSDSANSNTDDNKNNNSSSTNDKDGDGIPDDQDDHDDRDQDGDGQPDAPAESSESSTDTSSGDTNTNPSTNGTPNPDADRTDPHARQQWLTSTPFGQAEMKGMLDSVARAKNGGGGAADPENPGVNPVARAAFYNSPLFSSSTQPIKSGPGNVDYVDDTKQQAVLDKRQLDAIAIRSGGAVGGPEAGKKPINTAGLNNPVIPKAPITGGGTTAAVFSTTAITAKVAVKVSTAALKVSVAAVTH